MANVMNLPLRIPQKPGPGLQVYQGGPGLPKLSPGSPHYMSGFCSTVFEIWRGKKTAKKWYVAAIENYWKSRAVSFHWIQIIIWVAS